MLLKKIKYILILTLFSTTIFAQKDTVSTKQIKAKKILNSTKAIYNPLAPSKAAFYSAIFPGMGQIYNKKYWKAPIVWGALAIPTYYYIKNNNDYDRYRTAYKLRKNGLVDEFIVNGEEIVSIETLETAQKQLKENRDLSLLIGVILYVLQIIEASVNAHLLQFDTSDDLSIRPTFIQSPNEFEIPKAGLSLTYSF